MKQFDICENLHKGTARRAPYLLVLQSDLLAPFEVRLVAPLVRAGELTPIKKLTPQVEIGGGKFLLSMIEMASIRKQLVGKIVADMRNRRDEVIAAIDLIITGV